jgi:hypothetical protein
MSYPIVISGKNDVTNTFLDITFQNKPEYFNGSVVVSDLQTEATYNTIATPTAILNPSPTVEDFKQRLLSDPVLSNKYKHIIESNDITDTPPNISVVLSNVKVDFYDYENGQRGALQLSINREIQVWAVMGLNGSHIALSSLTDQVIGGAPLGNKILQKVLTNYVLPSLKGQIENIQLPQLQDILGTDLNASIANFNIVNQQFSIDASVAGFHFADQSNKVKNVDDVSSGDIYGVIDGAIVNQIMKTKIPSITKPFNKSSSTAGFGAGIKGSMTFSNPSFSISGGQATATGNLSLSAQAGIKTLWWNWVPLPVPDTVVTIKVALKTSSTEASVEITGIDSIHVNIGNWPSILKPIESAIESLLDAIVSIFQGAISSAVSGISINLFSLPSTIPGTDIPAKLTFPSGGLSFNGSNVDATINVSM